MMKKTVAVFLATVLIFGLSACGAQNSENARDTSSAETEATETMGRNKPDLRDPVSEKGNIRYSVTSDEWVSAGADCWKTSYDGTNRMPLLAFTDENGNDVSSKVEFYFTDAFGRIVTSMEEIGTYRCIVTVARNAPYTFSGADSVELSFDVAP